MQDAQKPQTHTNPEFAIQRLYVKEQTCKVPYAPEIYDTINEKNPPEHKLELRVKQNALAEDRYEVVLYLHVTTKQKEGDQTVMQLDVQQAGLFTIKGFDKEQQAQLLNGYCPSILYPYARKVISDISIEAGLPPILLGPINFDGLYAEQQRNATQNNNAKTAATTAPTEEQKQAV